MSEVSDHATPSTAQRPLTALIGTLHDGRALKVVFLGMLGLAVWTVGSDLRTLMAEAPQGQPGSQSGEPAPMELPTPGDQTRPYLPRSMPLAPGRDRPRLPGYDGPLDEAAMAGAMQFRMGADGAVSALGTITPGTAARLDTFLEDNPKAVGELVLHSPGGSVSDAIAMARSLRAEGVATRVPENGYCASACPLVLAGGLRRVAGNPSFVGVHQIYAPSPATGTLQTGMRDAQFVSGAAQKLLDDMGVDARLWIEALQTPPAQLYIFTPEELVRYNLANGRAATTVPVPRPVDEGAS